jgi:hypothetical protein
MTYSILDFNLCIKKANFKTLASAARRAISDFDQSKVWFIEDASGEIQAIVHCSQVWISTPLASVKDMAR